MFISVDLPAPFSPSSAWTSPRRSSKSTWSLATMPGNGFVIAAHLEDHVVAAAFGRRWLARSLGSDPNDSRKTEGRVFDPPLGNVRIRDA